MSKSVVVTALFITSAHSFVTPTWDVTLVKQGELIPGRGDGD